MSSSHTLRELAAMAGVSVGTVSRVLNKVKNVDPELRRRTLEMIKLTGYRLTSPGRRPAGDAMKRARRVSKVSKTVMVLFPELSAYCRTGSQWESYMDGIDRACRKRGYSTIICMADKFEDACKAVSGDLRTCCGALIKTGELRYASDAHRISELIPVVGFGHYMPGYRIPQAVVDDFAAGAACVESLVAQGHRRIAFVNADPCHPAFIGRGLGFVSAMKRLSLYSDDLFIEGVHIETPLPSVPEKEPPDMSWALKRALRLDPRPTALAFPNDWNALGFYRACEKAKLRIPDDFSVVGFDNIQACHEAAPPLSSVEMSFDEMCFLAANTLFDMVEGAGRHLRGKASAQYLQPRVHIRESVAQMNCDLAK